MFLPDALPQPFTSRDLATTANQPLYLTQKITYCLRKMGAIESAGKRGGALLYTLPNSDR
jgi:DNA-binding IscR family transcriptional regulator